MNKPTRILTALLISLALGGMNAYHDAAKGTPEYQAHPLVTIAANFFWAGLIAGGIVYLGLGWFARRQTQKMNPANNPTGGNIPAGKVDDRFYDVVAQELQEKSMVPGLWTRAIAETGDEGSTAKSLYIRLRVSELIRQEQGNHEKSIAEARQKVVEQRRISEAAKPPLKWYEKLANVLLGGFCGCATVLFTFITIACLSEKDRASSGMPLLETLMIVFFTGGIALSFGFITYKCFRSVLR